MQWNRYHLSCTHPSYRSHDQNLNNTHDLRFVLPWKPTLIHEPSNGITLSCYVKSMLCAITRTLILLKLQKIIKIWFILLVGIWPVYSSFKGVCRNMGIWLGSKIIIHIGHYYMAWLMTRNPVSLWNSAACQRIFGSTFFSTFFELSEQ